MGSVFGFLDKSFQKAPLTKIKISLGKLLYLLVIQFLGKQKQTIKRQGINYEVDLSEGIDFSLFLFGGFQKYITQNKLYSLPKDAVIFDVGANFGIMSLQFAMSSPWGRVYSFEPTQYAIQKFKKNLSLNPKLAQRIVLIKTFISDKNSLHPKLEAFSSWKIDGSKSSEKKHPVHWGTLKPTTGVKSQTLDKFCQDNKIKKIDFIKIDTDGHELGVLMGAKKIIKAFNPAIVFEVGTYLLKERDISFNSFLKFFKENKYTLFDAKSGIKITQQNYNSIIPQFGTIDILALYLGPTKSSLIDKPSF